MKILHVCSSSGWGGLEKYSVWLAGELRKRGHDVHYLCRAGTNIEKEVCKTGVPLTAIKGYLTYLDIRYILKIRELAIGDRYDIVHAHMSKDLGVIVPALWKTVFPKLFYSLHMIVPAPKKDLYHRIQYSRVNRIFALGEAGERSARENLPVDPEKVMELPYGIETEKYKPGKSPQLRKELGLNDSDVVLGILSRIDPLKGQSEAIRAMPEILRKYPGCRLVIVGEETKHLKGTLLPGLKKEIEKLNLAEKVIFTGYREDIPETLNMFDIFLLPSHFESYSISVIEAKLCGVPVVAASSGGIPQNMGDGKYGILVEPENAGALARGIIATLDDPTGTKKRVEAARENALTRYDWNKILDTIEKEYAACTRNTNG
jgi:glycosyltransferase involved in cell wall biosynthesis